MTVTTDELLDIIASAGLRLQREIKLAYKAGTLEDYLSKIGMEDLFPKKSTLEWDGAFPNGKIVILGESSVRDRDILKSIDSVGISPDRVELKLGYYDRSNEEFIRTLRYNNKYRLVLVGPMPHSTTATGSFSSALSMMQNTDGYTKVVPLRVNGELKITKTNIKQAVQNAIDSGYLER
ncbi:MAG: hypothetical protein SPL86_04610 [Succiniclasticum sp.]|uniref:hypothetical protein n=1 Tax=Succiniclasticum sp. TaxID=2775030 RepID=UPI002A918150|nr:hypothetical protein [Succiniclasticum sp.]MDY6290749.1 hypothetical protein [Succiniclasticum sp.]